MSISMAVDDRCGEAPGQYIPICSSGIYNRYWIPIGEELGLQWVKWMPALVLEPEMAGEFLVEMQKMLSWVERNEADDPAYPFIKERIRNLIEALIEHPIDRFEISFG